MIGSNISRTYLELTSPGLAQATLVFREASTLVRNGTSVCVSLNGYALPAGYKDGYELWNHVVSCFAAPGEFQLQDGSFRLSPEQCLKAQGGCKQFRNVDLTYEDGLNATALEVLPGCILLLDRSSITGNTAYGHISVQAGGTVKLEDCKLAGSLASQNPQRQSHALGFQTRRGSGCSVWGLMLAHNTEFADLHAACAVFDRGHAELTGCSVMGSAVAFQVGVAQVCSKSARRNIGTVPHSCSRSPSDSATHGHASHATTSSSTYRPAM